MPGARLIANRLNTLSGGMDKLKKSDFNFANTRAGKALTEIGGLKGTMAGQSKAGGYEGVLKKRGEKDAERAQRLEMSDEDKQDLIDSEVEKARKSGDENMQNLASQKQEADKLKDMLEKEKSDMESQHRQEMAELSQQAAQGSPRDAAAAQQTINRKQQEHKNALSAQDERIKAARQESDTAARRIAPQAFTDTADRAERMADSRFTNTISRWVGGGQYKRSRATARKQVGEKKKDKEEKRLLSKLRDQMNESGETTSGGESSAGGEEGNTGQSAA